MDNTDILSFIETQAGTTYGNFINGAWVTARSGKSIALFHAGNRGQLIGHFPDSDEEDVQDAVNAAHEAFHRWRAVPPPERAGVLQRFAGLLERDAEVLAMMLSAEQGKTLPESRGEVLRAAKETRFAAGEAMRVGGELLPSERTGVQVAVQRSSLGVVAAIAPWNFPVITPVRKIAPALAYGCTVVFKPASITPWCATKLMDLLTEAGVPAGVVNLVNGSGPRVGNPLVRHPLVRGISFTGSTALGKDIQMAAAGRFARTQLELGGKNPAIVLDYDDVNFVAKEIVNAAFGCTGQRCTAISRVIVQADVAEELTAALVHQARILKVGPAWGLGVQMGPLVNEAQLESVLQYVKSGLSDGAILLCGGERLQGRDFDAAAYMAPTIFADVTPNMRIAREEIFGPVLSVIRVQNWRDAIDVANDVEYGLAASVFTRDLALAHQCKEALDTGMVHINHGTASEPHVPFGGVKQSGFGAFSIGFSNAEFFTETKAVYTKY